MDATRPTEGSVLPLKLALSAGDLVAGPLLPTLAKDVRRLEEHQARMHASPSTSGLSSPLQQCAFCLSLPAPSHAVASAAKQVKRLTTF